MGFPPEQLDIIAEYGSQLTRAGFKAEEVQAIMEAALKQVVGILIISWMGLRR